MSYAHPHPGPPPELPELPEGAPPPTLPPRRQGSATETPWPVWTAPVGLLAAFGVALFGGAIIGLLGTLLAGGKLSDPPPGVLIAATFFQDACLVGAALLLARVTSRARGPWHFGLRSTRVGAAIGWLAAAYVGFLAITAAWLAFMSAVGVKVDSTEELPKELGADGSTLALVIVGVLVTIAAPIAEELFFRGFFFTALRRWKGVGVSAAITGAVFGLIHVGSSPVEFLAPLAFFGVLLCLLYWQTGSLFPCIGLHAINNSVAFGASQHWTWQIPLVVLGALSLLALLLAPFANRGRTSPAAAPGVG